MSTHEARWTLQRILTEWRDAGAPVEDVVDCIEELICAWIEEKMLQTPDDEQPAVTSSTEPT